MKILSWKRCIHPKHPGRVGKVEWPDPRTCDPADGRQGSGELHAEPEQVPAVSTATLSGSQSFEAGGGKRALRICVGCGSRPTTTHVRGSQLPSRPANC